MASGIKRYFKLKTGGVWYFQFEMTIKAYPCRATATAEYVTGFRNDVEPPSRLACRHVQVLILHHQYRVQMLPFCADFVFSTRIKINIDWNSLPLQYPLFQFLHAALTSRIRTSCHIKHIQYLWAISKALQLSKVVSQTNRNHYISQMHYSSPSSIFKFFFFY